MLRIAPVSCGQESASAPGFVRPRNNESCLSLTYQVDTSPRGLAETTVEGAETKVGGVAASVGAAGGHTEFASTSRWINSSFRNFERNPSSMSLRLNASHVKAANVSRDCNCVVGGVVTVLGQDDALIDSELRASCPGASSPDFFCFPLSCSHSIGLAPLVSRGSPRTA